MNTLPSKDLDKYAEKLKSIMTKTQHDPDKQEEKKDQLFDNFEMKVAQAAEKFKLLQSQRTGKEPINVASMQSSIDSSSGTDAPILHSMTLTDKLQAKLQEEKDPKFLNLSECTTPEGLSVDGDDRLSQIEGESSDTEDDEMPFKKPYNEYVVRLKQEPKFRRAKNKYDVYLTKTSLRAIKFSENKRRWHRIIDNDLYSKTDGRGIPALQRVELKNNQYVRSPPFFK